MTRFKVPDKHVVQHATNFLFRGEFANWLVKDDRNKRFVVKHVGESVFVDFADDNDSLEFIDKWMEQDGI